MANSYTEKEIAKLAAYVADDFASACKWPTIVGRKGERKLRGNPAEEVAKRRGVKLEELSRRVVARLICEDIAERCGIAPQEAMRITTNLSEEAFCNLPPYWQEVNIASAKSTIALMDAIGGEEVIMGVDTGNPVELEELGAALHQKWLDQPLNSWALGGELDRPFSELDPERQEAFFQQARSLQMWLEEIQRQR